MYKKESQANEQKFLSEGSEMGQIIQAVDWSKNPLGKPELWENTLKQTLSTILAAPMPMLICWGQNYIQFYNDAFKNIIQQKPHNQIIGTSAKDNIFKENWETIGPLFEELIIGKSINSTSFKWMADVKNSLNDPAYDCSLSSIRNLDGNIQGVLVICKEIIEQAKTGISQHDFQAINEELAEANEEYATTNEELVAANEEILTMQQELLHSEKLFKSIVKNIPKSLVIVIDKDHRIITLEGDLKTELGYNQKNYKDRLISEVLLPEQYEPTKQYYAGVLNGEHFSEELILSKDKNHIVHFAPLRNDIGEVTSALIITLDITDIKQAEEKSAKLVAIIESSDDAIISKTLESVITSWNDSAQRMFGYTAAEMIGETIYKLIPTDRREEEPNILNRLKNGERVEHFETKRLTKDGRLIDVSISISPIKDKNGKIIGLSKIARDISNIKEAEERSAKLAAIIESSDDAIISKTLESVITSWNDSAQRMFGYTAAEMIGESIYKIIPDNRRNEEPAIQNRLKDGERVEHFETKRLTKNGYHMDVSLTISPIRDTRGIIIGLSTIARDITEKKLEEQRKNDFVAMVSHELKTPLTTISSYVQLLLARARKEGDEFRINALFRTEVQTKKMTAMIHDFLSLARLDDGKITLNKTVFELQPLVEEIIGDIKPLSSNHEIEFIDCENISLEADRDKIGQVLNNLLSNGIKYSPLGGKITIGCIKQKGRVKVYVKDEGVGINPEDQKRLFERFFRSTNEKLKMVSGFGIGLYLVSEVLRFHNSRIELESEENVGSTFHFTLDMINT